MTVIEIVVFMFLFGLHITYFDIPEGTAVYAAREGLIYSFKDDSDEGDLLKMLNKETKILF
jgi:hypothetical protein